MRPAAAWRAEVVRVRHGADDREDDVVRHFRRGSGTRPGSKAENGGEEKNPSGCRPVASHKRTGAPVRALEGQEVSSGFGLSRVRGA